MAISNHKESIDQNQEKKTNFIQMNSFECNNNLTNLGCRLEGAYVCKTKRQYKSAQNLAQKDEIAVEMINCTALIPSNLL